MEHIKKMRKTILPVRLEISEHGRIEILMWGETTKCR